MTTLKVQLLRHTPDIEKLIAASAKLCYSPVGVDEIEEQLTDEATDKFLNIISTLGHESPLEHGTFTFAVEGVSRTLSHQLVRHRLASYSQQSQRYVKLDQFEYIIPTHIANDEVTRQIFIEHMKDSQRAYDGLVHILTNKHYKLLIEKGKSEKKAKDMAEKQAIEDARYVFPNACETKIVLTMNVRTLLNFFRLRCCNRAQWEIKELADEMLRQAREVAPIIFKRAGASCTFGVCGEGVMTCGVKRTIEDYDRK